MFTSRSSLSALPPLTEEEDEDLVEEAVPPLRRAAPKPASTAAPVRKAPRRPPGKPPASAFPVSSDKTTKQRATMSFVTGGGEPSTPARPPPSHTYDTSPIVTSSRASSRLGTSSGRVPSGKTAPAPKRPSGPSRKSMDSQKLQQLRGIFAAFDENRDGILTKEELSNALLSLGINPTPKVIQKYQIGSATGVIDLATFMNVTMSKMGDAESTAEQIMVAFEEFDPESRGVVSSQIVRHLLHELSVETALTAEEAEDLLRMMGIISKDGPYMGLGVSVDYRQLVDKMMFQ